MFRETFQVKREIVSEKYSIDRDLKETEAMAGALASYVRSDELYGRVGSGGMFAGRDMPSLTVGALLMRLRRLNALRDEMTDSQVARLKKAESQHGAVSNEWRRHYQQKMLREANSRLDAMSAFFDECDKS